MRPVLLALALLLAVSPAASGADRVRLKTERIAKCAPRGSTVTATAGALRAFARPDASVAAARASGLCRRGRRRAFVLGDGRGDVGGVRLSARWVSYAVSAFDRLDVALVSTRTGRGRSWPATAHRDPDGRRLDLELCPLVHLPEGRVAWSVAVLPEGRTTFQEVRLDGRLLAQGADLAPCSLATDRERRVLRWRQGGVERRVPLRG